MQGAEPAAFAAGAGAFFFPNRDFRPDSCWTTLLALLVAVFAAFAVCPPTEPAAPLIALIAFDAETPVPQTGIFAAPPASIGLAPFAGAPETAEGAAPFMPFIRP